MKQCGKIRVTGRLCEQPRHTERLWGRLTENSGVLWSHDFNFRWWLRWRRDPAERIVANRLFWSCQMNLYMLLSVVWPLSGSPTTNLWRASQLNGFKENKSPLSIQLIMCWFIGDFLAHFVLLVKKYAFRLFWLLFSITIMWFSLKKTLTIVCWGTKIEHQRHFTNTRRKPGWWCGEKTV